jgi:type I restriction enzyme S subunit
LSSVAVLRGIKALLDQRFLYQAILSDSFQKNIREAMSGQAITRITLEKIGAFKIAIPCIEEQYIVANCLSSLDEIIAAYTQKLEALKVFKKGLMQGLFPSLNETDA